VRARPLFMLLPPLLTFVVLCSLSIMGVILGADKFEADTRARAESAALDWVRVELVSRSTAAGAQTCI
jgi:hypothetical protein